MLTMMFKGNKPTNLNRLPWYDPEIFKILQISNEYKGIG